MNDSTVSQSVTCNKDIEELSAYLESSVGLNITNVDMERIARIIQNQSCKKKSIDEQYEAAAALIATHETYFLRHHRQFDWIQKTWAEQAFSQSTPGSTISILSAGCSTGEEPYSLFARLQPIAKKYDLNLHIDAIDINPKSIAIARQGKYGLWSMRGVDIANEKDWLSVTSRTIYVSDHVKKGVHFRQDNLLNPSFNRKYQLILCRNVLIYMHEKAVNSIYDKLSAALLPDGILLPGPSDPSPTDTDLICDWQGGIRTYSQSGSMPAPCIADPVSPGLKTPDTPDTLTQHKSPSETMPPERDEQVTSKTINSYHVTEDLIRSGEYDTARVLLLENIDHNSFDIRSYIMLAVLSLDMGDITMAEKMIRNAIYIDPGCLYAALLNADIKERKGDPNGAKRDLSWLANSLQQYPAEHRIPYCEEITIEQLSQVVKIRLQTGNRRIDKSQEIR